MSSNNFWQRPKLDIPKTKGEKIWDLFGYSIYFGTIIFIILVWGSLPDKVPAHFNFAGEVDRWGSKWELIIFPFIGVFLLLFMQFIEKVPETYNYPKRFNESNAAQFYLQSRKMMNQLKNIMLIIFALITIESILIAKFSWTSTGKFGYWQIIAILLGVGIPIVKGVIDQKKIK